MKSESEPWKLPVFIGSLVIVALLINTFFFTRATTNRQAKEQQEREMAAVVLGKKIAEETGEKLKREKAVAENAAAETKAALEKTDADAKTEREKAALDAEIAKEAASQRATQEAAAEHARYLARYLNSGFSRKPGTAAIAIAIASEQGTANYDIAAALARRFQTANVQMLTSFFKPEFVSDRFVAGVFSGQTAVFEKLELTNSLEGVLLGRQMVAYSTNASLENTITANLRLELMALPVGTTRESQSWEFMANGVGFRPHEARKLAEEHIIEQMAKDTNMVLAPRLQQR